jgi:hypothetical protein
MASKKQQMPCHSEKAPDDDPSKPNDGCFQTDHVLSEKSCADGFVLPVVSIVVPYTNSAILISAERTLSVVSPVNLGSVVLRV